MLYGLTVACKIEKQCRARIHNVRDRACESLLFVTVSQISEELADKLQSSRCVNVSLSPAVSVILLSYAYLLTKFAFL